jgi:hypothetical protein
MATTRGKLVTGVVTLVLALPAAAAAQSGFTDYGRSTADQYGGPPTSPPGNSGNTPGGTKGNPPPGPAGNPHPHGGAASQGGGKGTKPATAGGSRGTRGHKGAGGREGVLAERGGRRAERGAPLPLEHAGRGGLPFTGSDLGLVVLAGIVLAAAGFALRLGLRVRELRRTA